MPMMLGLVAGSLASGQLLSRAGGHYRTQAFIGLGIMALGMGLLSRMTIDTSYARAVVYIVITGIGLGVSLPLYPIAIQNTVSHSLVGVATSSVAFVRSIGGVLGLAIFGSVMNSRFASEFLGTISPAAREAMSPGQLDSLAHNPQALMNTEEQARLEGFFDQASPQGADLFANVMESLKHALSSAIAEVFLIGLVIAILAWVTNLWLKEIPLSKQHR